MAQITRMKIEVVDFIFAPIRAIFDELIFCVSSNFIKYTDATDFCR